MLDLDTEAKMNDSAFYPVAQRQSRPSPSRSAPGSPTRRGDAAIIATDMLNRALAVTRLMALRCEREYHTALRLHSPPLAGAALEHANDAGSHAHRIRERMRELGGEINEAAEVALPSQRTAREADNPLAAVIADDLSAARAALDGYREIAAFFATVDPPTCELLGQVIQDENERADDLAGLLALASAGTAH